MPAASDSNASVVASEHLSEATHALLLDYLSAPALAAPTLNFDGNCPGDGVFTVLGLGGRASFHFVYGEEEGSVA